MAEYTIHPNDGRRPILPCLSATCHTPTQLLPSSAQFRHARGASSTRRGPHQPRSQRQETRRYYPSKPRAKSKSAPRGLPRSPTRTAISCVPAWPHILRLRWGTSHIAPTADIQGHYAAHHSSCACRTTRLDPSIALLCTEEDSTFTQVSAARCGKYGAELYACAQLGSGVNAKKCVDEPRGLLSTPDHSRKNREYSGPMRRSRIPASGRLRGAPDGSVTLSGTRGDRGVVPGRLRGGPSLSLRSSRAPHATEAG